MVNMKTFIIAEAGVNHNGNDDMALQLVDTAAACGADAVKFQTFSAAKLVRAGAEKAEYQQRATGSGDQYSMLKALEMSPELHHRLVARCTALGIEFMSTPFDAEAADFLLGLGMKRVKVPSGEITNIPFLKFLASKGAPLIVSTGMATLDEIKIAVRTIAEARQQAGFGGDLADALTILHCTSNYPAKCSDVNLRAMQTIAAETGMPIGYSDHTLGLAVSTAAVALGARVIEKHFTLDRELPGPDHKASLTPAELKALVGQIRDVEMALGSNVKAPTESELPIRELVRRSVTTTRALEAGDTLGADDVVLLRPGTGIPPADMEKIAGKKALRALAAGTTLQWQDLG
ncbi:MAG: neuB [Massilia sp.]|nr:neuB [Massilia sp.]